MIDLEKLREDLAKVASDRLPKVVSKVEVEPAVTEDGDEFLLVTIALAKNDLGDDALEHLLEEIENEVAKQDDRYPSVRFQDAA